MSVIVCRQKRAEHPYYLEGLGVNIYTAQELCYVVYRNPLLFMDGFADKDLIDFIRDELGMGIVAVRMEQRMKSGELPEELLFLFIQESDYYTAVELNRLKQTVAALRRLPPLEYEKKKADNLVEFKQYGKAIAGYEEILHEADKKVDDQFLIRVFNNLGACYARIFQFRKAMEAYDKAYEKKKDLKILEKMYHLTLLGSGLELKERYRSLISKELEEQWDKDFQKAKETARESEALKHVQALFEKDSAEKLEEAAKLVEEWKQEYREMG